MKFPAKLKIGGFTWQVEENGDVSNEGNIFGSTHTRTQKIFLEPGLTKQKLEQTLLHEVMHAVWWQSGLSKMSFDLNVEETIVHALSMGLYQVFCDNNL